MSPFYDLDIAFSQTDPISAPLFSPTDSTTSSHTNHQSSPLLPSLPSSLIEGTSKDGNSRIPLIELDYQFSIVGFLDYCQFASLDVVLFRDRSEFFEPLIEKHVDVVSEETGCHDSKLHATDDSSQQHQKTPAVSGHQKKESRRLSVDVNNSETDRTRREHRSSYDSLNATSCSGQLYIQPLIGYSLNHLFLETLYKRLKQIHDKELRLPACDKRQLTNYLIRRKIQLEFGDQTFSEFANNSPIDDGLSKLLLSQRGGELRKECDATETRDGQVVVGEINWRCFMRKGNQENLMIVLIPDSLEDVRKWMVLIGQQTTSDNQTDIDSWNDQFQLCPIFVFRCSSTMINNQVLSFLNEDDTLSVAKDIGDSPQKGRSNLEADLSLHFGQPCKYFKDLRALNDELYNEILPLNKFSELSQGISDENTQELVHFRAFLRKIKNTVLKSRFSSLNDAYLSELFVHKDDISYYINNVDSDIQKKYHVSSHLRGLAEFIKSYEDYHDSLPKEPTKQCNQLLNSILLQKCGLFINQPIARFDEANPLMKQLHDKKLLFMMRCNYKVELPILEENLSNSTYLKSFLKEEPTPERAHRHHHHHQQQAKTFAPRQQQQSYVTTTLSTPNSTHSTSDGMTSIGGQQASSLGRSNNPGSRLMEMKCGSIGSGSGMALTGSSPVDSAKSSGCGGGAGGSGINIQLINDRPTKLASDYGSPSSSHINSIMSPSNDSFFLEAFKNSTCSIDEITASCFLDSQAMNDVGLRHEAHMAEVLKRKGERKESHHYRRVLRSKANYNQSHSAIDQALRKVDSLGRLEHFCLTPLLFSPAWRSKLAPVRDHTVGISSMQNQDSDQNEASLLYDLHNKEQQDGRAEESQQHQSYYQNSIASSDGIPSEQDEMNERWHQMICNNYIKEYEQYIQTLGFNSVQIRFPSSSKLQTSMSSSSGFASGGTGQQQQQVSRKTSLQSTARYSSSGRKLAHGRRDSSINSPSTSFIPITILSPINTGSGASAVAQKGGSSGGGYSSSNTGYLIKFLNSGCLVFKVGFCKPYVYSILYSIEGERFNNSNTKVNMTAFLDELDSIKVTLHLHSFTYDYHLRSMYSYISRHQINFNPGYHLISFADDFRKYYQKAPNYARNHILSGELIISGLKVDGQQLYNYIVTHNSIYQLEVLEMTNTTNTNNNNLLGAGPGSPSAAARTTDQASTREGAAAKAQSATQQFASFLSSQFGTGAVIDGKQMYGDDGGPLPLRNHANDYVLIELKREKVRYKDGSKDPDIFDCGLLIAHDHEKTNATKNCLALRYFLILTNQRDLYPKLLHTGDIVIGLGCHRPIRLGIVNQLAANVSSASAAANRATAAAVTMNETSDSNDTTLIEQHQIQYGSSVATTTILNSTDLDDVQSASEFLSSSELSGPQSILSTVNSIQSSSSAGFNSQQPQQQQLIARTANISDTDTSLTSSSIQQKSTQLDSSSIGDNLKTEEAAEALVAEELSSAANKKSHPRSESSGQEAHGRPRQSSSSTSVATTNEGEEVSNSVEVGSANREPAGSATGSVSAPDETTTTTNRKQQQQQELQPQERTICDEEITYLGYFSSDEMDMLKFLQEKTASLKSHLEEIVYRAEVHFRRDYLWHKLMQRQSLTDQSTSIMGGRSSSAPDQLPLTLEELIQLLSIVEAIDLATLDPSLATFMTMHISWYLKLLKTFNELKQSPAGCQHRIYTVKASKILLLYIDPKCTTAFVLLSVNVERGSVELSMLLKEKQDCCSNNTTQGVKVLDQAAVAAATKVTTASSSGPGNDALNSAMIDLDADCQQLISDFINFCATFMWSNLLT